MDNDNAIYEQQEEQMKARTEAFIKLLTQRGILEDKKIKDARIREVQRSKKQLSYHNTMMLLKNYRTIAWIVECFPDTIAEELERPFERTDALLDRVDVELCMGKQEAGKQTGGCPAYAAADGSCERSFDGPAEKARRWGKAI